MCAAGPLAAIRKTRLRRRELLLREKSDRFLPLLHLRLQRRAGLRGRRFQRRRRLQFGCRFHGVATLRRRPRRRRGLGRLLGRSPP